MFYEEGFKHGESPVNIESLDFNKTFQNNKIQSYLQKSLQKRENQSKQTIIANNF